MDFDGGTGAVFERIGREATTLIRNQLFTVTAFDAETMQVQRVHSSNPAAYPVGGRKPKRDTKFGHQVLIDGQPLICEGDAAIAGIFDDHATIHRLGLHSSINAPVLIAGRCIGVLNFLMPSERVTAEQLRAACALASDPGVIAALASMGRFDGRPACAISG